METNCGFRTFESNSLIQAINRVQATIWIIIHIYTYLPSTISVFNSINHLTHLNSVTCCNWIPLSFVGSPANAYQSTQHTQLHIPRGIRSLVVWLGGILHTHQLRHSAKLSLTSNIVHYYIRNYICLLNKLIISIAYRNNSWETGILSFSHPDQG